MILLVVFTISQLYKILWLSENQKNWKIAETF